MTVTSELAHYASTYAYEELPQDVVEKTKRIVLDTLGCAIGGYTSQASQIMQKTVKEMGGLQEATVFGSGLRTSVMYATLANGTMVRYLDYNDAAVIKYGDTYRLAYHPSEIIPTVLALGEMQHISGKDAILAINVGYDLSARFFESIVGREMEKRGWNGDTRGAYIMPFVAGKILGLTDSQMENAAGISGSRQAILGILDAPAEEYTMTKNIRFPSMAFGAILATLLAKNGFTGPTTIIEGQDGFAQVIMQNEFDTSKWTAPGRTFGMRDTCFKPVVADQTTHGHVTATLSLVRDNNIRPQDVDQILVKANTRCAAHTGELIKKYPKNKETADHSSYYLTAIAIIDREVGPDQFTPEKYVDPMVRILTDKVSLSADPSLDKTRLAGDVTIVTKDGKRYNKRVDYPKGHPMNPMSDEEIIHKFDNMAKKYLNKAQSQKLISTVLNMDDLKNVSELVKAMVFG